MEQYLQSNDSSRLLVHKLDSYVTNEFTNRAEFDFELFYKNCYEGMRLGDDLIDLEYEYIQRIIDKIESDPEPKHIKWLELDLWKRSQEIAVMGRRVGMGITALGDTLAALGFKYDSDESLEIIDKIMKTKMEAELDCTIDLAILRGTFDGWNENIEYGFMEKDGITASKYGNKFYLFLYQNFPFQSKRMQKYGRRNVSWSTISPTGSVSLLANNCTSGCEPLFKPYYMRRKKINPNEKGIRIDFVDETGDSWQEFPVLHPKFKEWITISHSHFVEGDISTMSKEDLQQCFEESPWYKSTANDIDWIKRVKIQSILQKYTTNAISSTINLPNDVSEEEVSKIYLESWKKGLKGVTVYVDGSRSGVLVENNNNKKKEEKNNDSNIGYTVIKRPNPLKAKVVRFNNNHEKWIAIVGVVDNRPYELFTGLADELQDIPKHIEEGYIIKRKDTSSKKSIFYFRYDNSSEIEISNVFNKEYWNYTKLLSGILRHGMSLEKVIGTVEGLNLDDRHLNTWKAGVLRVLRKFQSTNTLHDKKCPECGDPDGLIFEDGCLKCKSCGHSKCG